MEEAEEEEQCYHWSAAAAAVVSCQWRSQRWEGQQEGLRKGEGEDEWAMNMCKNNIISSTELNHRKF
jgi:hypothetical protein